MAKNILDLDVATGTNDTDIVHINRSNKDYKEAKVDFMGGRLRYSFATDTDLTAQADALPSNGTYFGTCPAYGHQQEVGIPVNSGIFVCMRRYSSSYIEIEIHTIGQSDSRYIKSKGNGTWETEWTKMPTRAEQNRIGIATTINGSGTATLTFAANSRAIVAITATAAERCGLWLIQVGSTGQSIYATPIGSVGAKIQVSTATAPKLVITSTAGGSYIQPVCVIVFQGSYSVT